MVTTNMKLEGKERVMLEQPMVTDFLAATGRAAFWRTLRLYR